MSSGIMISLQAATKPPYCDEEEKNERLLQIENGLVKFFEKSDLFRKHSCNFCFVDNTISSINELTEKSVRLIEENNVAVFCNPENGLGSVNKGMGMVDNLKFVKSEILKHDWIIHFEPRQLLVDHQFFESFFENPRNLFTFNKNPHAPRHFNTGLFAVSSKDLIAFIDAFSPEIMHRFSQASVSIEYVIHDFFVGQNIKFDTVDKMNLIWFDSHQKKQKLM